VAPEAVRSVRGDTFVVETNIHYPTESSLISDGLRKVVMLAVRLAELRDLPGWRHTSIGWPRSKRWCVRSVERREPRVKGRIASSRGIRNCCLWPVIFWGEPRKCCARLSLRLKGSRSIGSAKGEQFAGRIVALHSVDRKVCGTARRRVLLGEVIPHEEKIFSIYEPHTELIKRGKQPIRFNMATKSW